MAKTAGKHLPTWERCSIPGFSAGTNSKTSFLAGAGIFWDKGNFLYCFNQGYASSLMRYDLRYDAWQYLQGLSGPSNNNAVGISGIWHVAESKFYLKSASTYFDGWDKTSTICASLSPTSNSEQYGMHIFHIETDIHASGDDDVIFYCPGYTDTNFEKYSISGDSWASQSSLPEAMTYVGWQPTVDATKLYAISRDLENYYSYTIATNTWSGATEWQPNVLAQNAQYGGFFCDDSLASTSPGSYAYVMGYYPRHIYRANFSTNTFEPYRDVPVLENPYSNYSNSQQLCYAETGGSKYLYWMVTGTSATPSYYMFRTEIF